MFLVPKKLTKKQQHNTVNKIQSVHLLVSAVMLIISTGSVLGKQGNMVKFKSMAFKHIIGQDQIHQISYEYFLLSSSLLCVLVLM